MTVEILTVLNMLAEAGIWVNLSDEGVLTVGPEHTVQARADLLQLIRTHKPFVIHAIQSMQAHAFFGREADDTRFETATCLECSQEVYVVLSPRRLAAHRLIDGMTSCPGSDRAQLVIAGSLLEMFILDRCLPRPQALLTWTSLRATLLAWCAAREFWLPPPQYLQQWMAEHYQVNAVHQSSHSMGPVYVGLTLKQEEWLGDDEQSTAAAVTVAAQARAAVAVAPKKAKLVATGKPAMPHPELWPDKEESSKI